MEDGSKSVLIRINSKTKNLLKELLEENPSFKSYGELLNFFLQNKSTSKAYKLVESFLLMEKKMSSV